MTRLGSGYPTTGAPRNNGQPVQQTGIAESLIAPGIAPLPPTSAEAAEAQEVLRAIGFVGDAAQNVGSIAYHRRREIELDNEQIKQQYRNQAALDAKTALPQLLQDIADEKITVPDVNPNTGQPYRVEDFARQYVEERLADAPEAYAEQYRAALLPNMTAALVGQQEVFKERVMAEDIQVVSENTDPTSSIAYLEATYGDRLSETQRLTIATKNGLEAAVDQGDPAAFDRYARPWTDRGRGGEYVEAQRLRLQERIRANETRAQIEAKQAAENAVAAQYVSWRKDSETARQSGVLPPPPPETIPDTIEREAVSPEMKQAMYAEFDREKAAYQRQTQAYTLTQFQERMAGLAVDSVQNGEPINVGRFIETALSYRGVVPDDEIDKALRDGRLNMDKAIRQQFIEEQTRVIIEEEAPMLDAGDETGGSANVQDITIVPPVGEPVTLKAEDRVAAIRDRRFALIDQAFPTNTAEAYEANVAANLTQRLNWLRMNPVDGEGKPVKDPSLRKLFDGVARRVPPDATAESVPAAATLALDTYIRGQAIMPEVINEHMGERDLQYMRLAKLYHEELGMDKTNSLLAASTAMRGDPESLRLLEQSSPDSRLLKQEVDDLVSGGYFGSDARNSNDIAAVIATRAKAYIIYSGVSDEKAIERAAEEFSEDYRKINGWYVRTRGKPILNQVDLDAVGRVAVGYYLSGRPDGRAQDFTVLPDRQTGQWRISFLATGLPAEESPAYSDADMMVLQQAITSQDAYLEGVKAINERERVRLSRRDRAVSARQAAFAQALTGDQDAVAAYADIFSDELPPDPGPRLPTPAYEAPAFPQHLQGVVDWYNAEPNRIQTLRRTSSTESERRSAFNASLTGDPDAVAAYADVLAR